MKKQFFSHINRNDLIFSYYSRNHRRWDSIDDYDCAWVGIKKIDEHYILLARRWARGFVITVAVGVVTGTAIGLQLSLLWLNFMELAGSSPLPSIWLCLIPISVFFIPILDDLRQLHEPSDDHFTNRRVRHGTWTTHTIIVFAYAFVLV